MVPILKIVAEESEYTNVSVIVPTVLPNRNLVDRLLSCALACVAHAQDIPTMNAAALA